MKFKQLLHALIYSNVVNSTHQTHGTDHLPRYVKVNSAKTHHHIKRSLYQNTLK